MATEASTTQLETEFVFRRLTEALNLGGKEVDARLWLLILIPVLLAAGVYVVWMYIRDSRTVGWRWASFLGALRLSVYFVLAWVFLLPALQTWEKSEKTSKVVMLLDVSGSMGSKDDLPTEAMPVEKLLTRQDKVTQFLSSEQIAFLNRLQKKNPVTLYRFGSVVDEEFKIIKPGEPLTAKTLETWLKPDPKQDIAEGLKEEEQAEARKKIELLALLVNGTDVGKSLRAVLNRESANLLQGIIVVSDGRSTSFSSETFNEVRARAAKADVPIFAIAIGEHRDPINIRITEQLAPDSARPDDKFPVRVEIDGEGLSDQDVTAFLDVYKPESDKPSIELKATARFKPGEPPHAQVEFQIDPLDLPPELCKTDPTSGKPELLEGDWKFVARVPKDRREVFLPKEHVTEPETVKVIKKPLRVLLLAGGPSKDYQFARTLFVREVDNKRAELSIFLQIARPEVVQDVPTERFLFDFPSGIREVDDPGEKPEDKYSNLLQYDVIIAIDPDWTKLTPEQIAAVEKWVSRYDGGLILVGGTVNTFQLSRGVNQEKLKPLLDLFPVILEDNRVQAIDRTTTDPWRLNFPGATNETDFLRLDEDSKEPLAGWEEFFTGFKRGEGNRDAPLRRGFFDYYPVREVKPSATIVGTFTDPRARTKEGREQPYLVTMPFGGGKVVWIGSGEIWRLRQFREAFHERFWTKLCRYVSGSSQASKKSRSTIVMGKSFPANNFVRMEARLYGRDMQPLNRVEKPKVIVKPPPGVAVPPAVELQAKPTQGAEWEGWFAGRFLVNSPGNYEVQLQVPGTPDILSSKFMVKEANPELDNTRPDFAQLRQIASRAEQDELRDGNLQKKGILPSLNDEQRIKLRAELMRTNSSVVKDSSEEDRDLRLYFDLKGAELIPECLDNRVEKIRNRGPVKDLWDYGFTVGDPPLTVSYTLIAIIGLLSLEWLTRKLLKLA